MSAPAQIPIIVRQPQFAIVAPGASVTFDVAVDPSAPNVRYQWRLNGGPLSGETDSSLVISNVQFSVAGVYSVAVFNDFGAITSDPATLMLNNIQAFPFSDKFDGAVGLIGTFSGRIHGSNAGATAELGEPPHAGKTARRSVWAKWTAPAANGIVTFRTAGSGFDTVLAVYTGSSIQQIIEAGSDDDGDGFLTSQVRFQVEPRVDYYVAIDGFGGGSGPFILDWNMEQTPQLLPVLTLQPFDQAVLPGASATLTVDGSPDLLWQWFFNGQPMVGETTRNLLIRTMSVANVGTYFCRAFLGSRSRDSRAVRLQMNFDDFGRVDIGRVSTEKLFDARLRSNDFHAPGKSDQAKAVARGFSGTQIFSTIGSTKEPGEPNHCGVAGGASEWFACQAEADGTLYINTDGSNFDTVLAVYTGPGDEFATLNSVACDNNSGLDGRDSRVSFEATANTIYWIAVDGVNQANGNPAKGNVALNYRLVQPLRLTTTGYTNTAGGKLTFRVSGTPHLAATIQASVNLSATNWTPLITNASASGVFNYTNTGVNFSSNRVFRALNRF